MYTLLMKLLCPVCKKPLHREGRSCLCENRHTFDYAKSGYLNLYLSSRSAHGDNREMVRARTAFLETGAYSFLRSRLKELIGRPDTLVDLACGEGYYTRAMEAHEVWGFDLSRDALMHAAKKTPEMHWILASIFALPLADACTDCVLTCFAPFAADEIFRILKPGGRFLFVTPGPGHLFEMKEVLYDTPYLNPHKDLETPLQPVHEETIRSTFEADQEMLSSLFAMTPYAYRTGRAGREKLGAVRSLQLTAEFVIRIYQKP